MTRTQGKNRDNRCARHKDPRKESGQSVRSPPAAKWEIGALARDHLAAARRLPLGQTGIRFCQWRDRAPKGHSTRAPRDSDRRNGAYIQTYIQHPCPCRGCSAAPLCRNPEMVLQTAPAAPEAADRQNISRFPPGSSAEQRRQGHTPSRGNRGKQSVSRGSAAQGSVANVTGGRGNGGVRFFLKRGIP